MAEKRTSVTERHAVPDLHPPAHQLVTLLGGVTDDWLPARTPCPEYAVGDLLDHIMGLTIAFRLAATKSAAEREGDAPREPGDASAANLDPEWRRRLPERLDALVAAWREPAAWEGMTSVGGISLPGAMAGGFARNELILHGWDLARATGLAFGCDPAVADAALGFTAEVVDQGIGAYGAPVEIPDGAPVLDRLVALAGRDPSWTP